MKVVLDTNVLIAAFISHGSCNEILEYCVKHHELVTSPFILNEFHKKLVDKFGMSKKEADDAVTLLKNRMLLVKPVFLDKQICRDRDDDAILGTALAAQAQCVVSGDPDLTVMKRFQKIDLISPRQFWAYDQKREI